MEGLKARLGKTMSLSDIADKWSHCTFSAFPHDKILDLTKLKAFADDKLNVSKMIIFVFDRVENIVGEKEKLLVQANSPFPTIFFKRLLSQTRQKVSLSEKGLSKLPEF